MTELLGAMTLIRPPGFAGAVELVRGPRAFRRYPARVGGGFELCVSRNAVPPTNQVDGQTFRVPSGTLLVVRPGTVWTAEGEDAFRSIEIAPELFARWCEDVVQGAPSLADAYEPRDVRGLAGWVERAHAALARECDPLAAAERVSALLGTVVRRCTAAGIRPAVAPARTLDRVRELLHRESARRFALPELVERTGARVGAFQLLRSFQRRYGVTPHHYQRLARAADALERLRRGQPAADVATDAGFYDQAHLTRQLTRIYGITPAAYARGQRRTRPRTPPVLRSRA